MEVLDRICDVRRALLPARRAGSSIGLVPTMGYLHEGHGSLILRAREECGVVGVSIFVNPTQFGPTEDLERYPRDLEGDTALCERLGADLIFCPSALEMYPDGPGLTQVTVSHITEALCGRSRPVHFGGVALVVAKLFGIFQPDRAYFGEKDFQQLTVIRRMVADLNMPIEIVGCPTVRETDGLAMSSRNAYLTPEQRAAAPALHEALQLGAGAIESGETDVSRVAATVRSHIESAPGAEIDYVEIVDASSLQPVEAVESAALLAVAVRFGETRLIDNITALPPAARQE